MRNYKFNTSHIILIVYLIFSFFASFFLDTKTFNLIINPLFWFILLIYLILQTNNNHGRFSNLEENYKTMIIIILFYFIIYFLSGLIFGYAKSPYSHNIKTIILNFIQLIIPIIGLEYARSTILNENKNVIALIIFTIIFILFEIEFPILFSNLNNRINVFEYIGYSILPIIFSNILYSYITLKGSYKLVLLYRLPVELAILLVPILPDYDWFMQGFVGIIVPVIIYIIFKYTSNHKMERSRRSRKKINPIIYFPFLSIIIAFVLFMAGVFIYEPIAILSNSMVPVFYRGDVVIYRKLDGEDLKNIAENTIIIYSKEGQAVVHRVTSKYYKKGSLYYITKGDANTTEDLDPVKPDQVVGEYQMSIRYIGLPSVWLNDVFKHEEAKVEIK